LDYRGSTTKEVDVSVREDMAELRKFFPELVDIAESLMSCDRGRARRVLHVIDMMPAEIFHFGPNLSGLKEREMRRILFRHDPCLGRMTARVAVVANSTRVAKKHHRRG
jgi:hypothetical protein